MPDTQFKVGRMIQMPLSGSTGGRPFSVQDEASVFHTTYLKDDREVEYVTVYAHNSGEEALDLTLTIDETGGEAPETFIMEINPKEPPVLVLEMLLLASGLELSAVADDADVILLTGKVVREERV